jgi:hypothetical protein
MTEDPSLDDPLAGWKPLYTTLSPATDADLLGRLRSPVDPEARAPQPRQPQPRMTDTLQLAIALDEALDRQSQRRARKPRRPSAPRELRKLEQAGKSVSAVKHHPDGSFVLLLGEPEPAAEPVGANVWDAVLLSDDHVGANGRARKGRKPC